MSQTNQGEVKKYKSQTTYVFAHSDTGEIFRYYSEESFTPIPEPGNRVVVGDTTARRRDEGEWKSEEQDYDRIVVTDVEYQYNNVLFESGDGAARRLLTEVWIFGVPIEEETAER